MSIQVMPALDLTPGFNTFSLKIAKTHHVIWIWIIIAEFQTVIPEFLAGKYKSRFEYVEGKQLHAFGTSLLTSVKATVNIL